MKVLSVVAVNDVPVLTAGGASPTFTEDAGAVAIDPGLAVTDVDDTNLESATVTITNLLNAGAEILAASTAGTSIAASYVAPTLTLTGPDTLANYQAVLRSVTYLNSSQNPTTAAPHDRFPGQRRHRQQQRREHDRHRRRVNDAPTVAGRAP